MKTLCASKDGEYIVRIAGDIDHHSSTGVREDIDEALINLRPKRLILDLSETDFMDSSGLGLILGRLRKTAEMGIGFVLVNPTEAILKILRLAGVEKMLEIRIL